MSSSSSIVNPTSSFNSEAAVPMLIIFLASIGYYYYKYRNARNFIDNIGVSRNTNSNSSNNEVPINYNNERSIERNDNEAELIRRSNESNNINTTSTTNRDENKLNIRIHLQNGLIKSYIVEKNMVIKEFINNILLIENASVINIRTNQCLVLIFQGKKFDESKKFLDYTNLFDDALIYSLLLNKQGENLNNANINSNLNTNSANDPQSVNLSTIFVHIFIAFCIGFFLTLYKTNPNLVEKNPFRILQALCLLWLVQCSKCVAKIFVYKKVNYL